MACHGRAGVAAGYAPSLIGVIGRPAGSVPGFAYSPALRKSGIVWSDDKLMKWISNAPATVPGTPMPHVSLADPAERFYVLEYLKTLSPGAKKSAR
jgi:cytochrome c